MNLNSKRMEGVSVQTRSGRRLGKVASFELDADTGKLAAVLVRPQGVVTSLIGSDLIIAWGQVVDMSEDLVTVDDAAVLLEERALAAASSTNV